ncbi:MAG TPA: transcriptional regulator [Candidatus Dormibacteraeota bacterium]|nr:transcriptional regulator [Candidatus Dormibacteraeota bacterium]
MSHPRYGLDDLLGHAVRFSIAALLAAARKAEFSFVRDHVEVTDSMLSKQVSLLEQAGYMKVEKGHVGKRPRTWLSLTREGRRAFDRHLAALREIAQGDGVSAASAGSRG